MKIKISLLLIVSILCSLLCACGNDVGTPAIATETESYQRDAHRLAQSEDMGKNYIDSIVFFGESTTAHMKSRGVLSGGKETKQVWAPEGGTVNLNGEISNVKIVYPETGELITVAEASAKKKPPIIILTFGLNGAPSKIKHGKDSFCEDYMSLINGIRQSSPTTKIILQSCFPIAKSMDMSNYSIDASTLNEYITEINLWTESIAKDEGLWYIDTSSALCDKDGFLRPEFDNGDGYHLTKQAYMTILECIRTHGIKE